ncbi:rHS repeat-associated core domain-containing protein [Prevotella sp. CAG:474]|nr:rHS repeat-associated core domain-containing protein [Prevotella sp. CAG:474]
MRRQIVIMLLGLMTILSLSAFAIAGSRESNHATQPYKYIGKELDRTHGLDWYDHGARHYAPVTGRWNAVDALAEKDYAWSHDERASYADGSLSEKMGGLPVLIVGHDGYTRGFIYNDREIELVRNGVQIY